MTAWPAALLLLALVAAAPVGAAAGAALEATAIAITAEAPVRAPIRTLALEDFSRVDGWRLVAPSVVVEYQERRGLATSRGWYAEPAETHRATYPLTDVEVTVLEATRGRNVIARVDERGELVVPAREPARFEARTVPQFTSALFESPERPYVLYESTGDVEVAGNFSLVFYHMTARLEAAENTTVLHAGRRSETPASGDLRVATETWLVVHVRDGVWRASTDGTLSATLEGIAATDVTACVLEDARGSVGDPGAGARVAEPRLALTGLFSLEATPRAAGGDATLDVRADGRLEGYGPPLPQPDEARRLAGVVPALAAAAVAAAGAGLLALRRRRASVTVEELKARADEAAERGDFAEALRWTRRAMRVAPTSAQLHADAGYFLTELGDVDGALASLERAASRTDDGYPSYLVARLLARTGSSADDVAPHVRAALARTPELVLELEEDSVLQTLAAHPDLARAVAAARARAGAVA